MADNNDIDITSDQASQNLYADSDLAPMTSLFGEMGRDRSFWSQVSSGVAKVVDVAAAYATGGLSMLTEHGLDGFKANYNEVNKDLDAIGISRENFEGDSNSLFVQLTSFRKSEMNHLKDEKARTLIFEKIYQSGLIQLAEMAGGIREFAKLRFKNAETLRASAAKFNDPTRDTLWLEKLIQVKNYFYKDPLALTTVYKYFPNLYRLFITALAATGDYGHNIDDDPLNNHNQIMENMFKAFGTDEEGNAVFKPIWAVENFLTAQKIDKVIKDMGWNVSNAPASPDIFHLRLGASNFYVPPISINVNTGFQTGSLTGGAIRQKASPKFNTGYRDTTISLKLYFPNYEEIWGITIDDATRISLNSNFHIDFKDPEHEQKIDKFLSSLRGLVASFKYAPIIPIKNHYLNSVFDITGVALSSMTVSTVPGFPFTLEVDLELFQFNHKPFLPMIKDFNQAVHWGKYRHYMGRAAGALANSVSAEFLTTAPTQPTVPGNEEAQNAAVTGLIEDPNLDNGYDTYQTSPYGAMPVDLKPYNNGVLTTNVYRDWTNGNGITLYVPESVQSKIFSPDTASFRSDEEKAVQEFGRAFWQNLLFKFGINVTDEALYRSLDTVVINSTQFATSLFQKSVAAKIVDVALAGANAKNVYEMVYDALVIDHINTEKITNLSVIDYLRNRKTPNELQTPNLGDPAETQALKDKKWELYLSSQSVKGMLAYKINSNTEAILRKKKIDIDKNSKDWASTRGMEEKKFVDAFMVTLYERTFQDESIKSLLEVGAVREAENVNRTDGTNISAFTIREWEIPMMKIDLDPQSVIVNSVSLSMGNNLARLQLQMQEEPTFQYIGSKDTMISIAMTIFGENELRKIKKMFDFLSGLARLEHAAGVIGFMGIKNIITALAGVKYVLPLNFSVQTVEGFPHVYNVQLMLVDFDIFQQKRENISSQQQAAFIKEFGSKRNPFLRLKQRWDMINTYPDLPLDLVDADSKDMVGTLDPDFYFRSFEMYDDDVVKSIIDPSKYTLPTGNTNEKNNLSDRGKSFVYFVKKILIENNGDINKVKEYLIDQSKLSSTEAMKVFRIAIFDQMNEPEFETPLQASRFIANKYPSIWKDMIDLFKDEDNIEYAFEDVKFGTKYGELKIGDVVSGSKEEVDKFNKLITDSIEKADGKELPSFDPDDVDHFGLMHFLPAADSGQTGKLPAIYQTPDGGYVLGYQHKEDGRFYIAQDYLTVDANGKMTPTSKVTQVSDTQSPERDSQNSHTGVPTAKSLDSYMNAYGTDNVDASQAVSTGGSHKGVAKHWQKMMLDTRYRDIGGRMIRAFPTYMLWLIDDSNFFAGVKLFDNFYGLQSIIDFSIVQSEDILGDTLMLRLSNTYSKLSRPELTLNSIINTDGVLTSGTTSTEIKSAATNLSQGTAAIVQTLLNRTMNIKSHMSSKYVTEIENMRLKPGVRVHLRAGYGSNPNSLQTIFNGVIAEVEHGEIMTIIAQSDAIELSPIINSTKKKGDSGKIDGGINTGLWMSEPRDLMIRLLSMGASRMREAFAHATRGAVFSENKFGIRHFGSILYAPLSAEEEQKAMQYKASVVNAFNAIAKNPVSGTAGLAWNSTVNIATGGTAQALNTGINIASSGGLSPLQGVTGLESAGGSVRTPVVGAMQTLWANFSTQRDLEIFKRNIYPGNGVGVAQFLGGDLDDGWSTMASMDISMIDKEKFGYLDRLSNNSWSGLIDQSGKGVTDAAEVLEKTTANNKLVDSSHSIGTSKIIAGTAALAVGYFASPVAGLALGSGLLGSMNGRGLSNIMKTMGLVSDLDDDIYDEVSFRAQTYMRSIWDMFQMCARLLPNYIVAVRPFEDRSTIFYGKPHWLYTSGVFPVSTGFPNEENARTNGINTPGYINPDDTLNEILSSVNKNTGSTADAMFAAGSNESTVADNMASMAKDIISGTGIFAAGGRLRGKVINFADTERQKYYHYDKIVSRLPVNKGKVQVGFHLPFASSSRLNPTLGDKEVDRRTASKQIDAPIQQDHKQIDQLPIRFRYPFFSNRASGTLPSLDYDKIVKSVEGEDVPKIISNIVQISLLEKSLVSKDKDSDTTALVTDKEKGGEPTLDFNFNFASKLPFLGLDQLMTDTAAFDPSGIYDPKGKLGIITASRTVRMPLPVLDMQSQTDIQQISGGQTVLLEKFEKYYDDLDPAYALQDKYKAEGAMLDFTEWGMPASAEDEQFYIAMRWPYNPLESRSALGFDGKASGNVKQQVLQDFLKMYNLKEEDLVGSPEEYKKRKVLVYNPEKKVAVVCTPAYFLWGETEADGDGSNKIDAVISPDAAYFLHLLINDKGQILSPLENLGTLSLEQADGNGTTTTAGQWEALGMAEQNLKECMFTFVPDGTPVGVVTSDYNPANQFSFGTESFIPGNDTFLIGFGAFKTADEGRSLEDQINNGFLPAVVLPENTGGHPSLRSNNHSGILSDDYTFDDVISLKTSIDWQREWSRGGNYLKYYDKVSAGDYESLKQDKLIEQLEQDKKDKTFENFVKVYDPIDSVSVTARGFYDEKFDSTVKTIAGNGRRVYEAQQIWDQFRYGYHNYDSVKNIFYQMFNLDPDDDTDSQDPLFELLTGSGVQAFEEFGADSRSSEFSTLLGADWVSTLTRGEGTADNYQFGTDVAAAIDIAVNEYVDGGFDGFDENRSKIINKDKGIIDAYNALVYKKVSGIRNLVKGHFETYEYGPTQEDADPAAGADKSPAKSSTNDSILADVISKLSLSKKPEDKAKVLLSNIKTPKQLFLLLVGIFRQKLWADPYARAWVVLRPDKKRFNPSTGTSILNAVVPVTAPVTIAFNLGSDENDDWSFRSFDRIFNAFIDYNAEYATNPQSLIKLLKSNAKEGSNAGNWITGVLEDVDNFWDRNIGPIFTAFDAALGNLLNMFRMSMAQMGYGLNELENFTKQANILNKAYNDSIYYSLGRQGTLLRAVDNPFTREYGEPVVEVREPFQRLHYISSFTHILKNNIKENFSGVATQITAVSDGKYPVTVSLDKAAPPERQVEKTVETGIYFDNVKGEGVWGILHPIFHPLQTARGIAKAAQGDPDELTARRVALSHLKESLKDIYGGEIIVIGNADIRPHDIVYLADVYERMYGIFEVEQVVHHFTPETGFVTSITPNAFVTVNDPARWFLSSWMASQFSMQNLRNDTRLLLANKSNNSRLTINGDVSVDRLGDMLKDQMVGGMQYTHGHSALLKDIQANALADSMPEGAEQMKAMIAANTGRLEGSVKSAVFAGLVMPAITATATVGATMLGGPIAGAAVAAGLSLATDGAWNAWKWVRDNVLDQHGCYIQYLSKNGQPMDAGLSNFQGMVVGKYHSIKLLPGLLNVRTKTKSIEGNAFIRSDDLLKNMGWKEKEIGDLVRYISLENAIVHSQLLKYSGLGPEKTGLNQYFKTIVYVKHVVDGDTIDVIDVLSGSNETYREYRVRFDGVDTSELQKNNVSKEVGIIDVNSTASKGLFFTKAALEGRLIVLRVSPNNSTMILTADDLEAGALVNNRVNYATSRRSEKWGNNGPERYMASVFYKTDAESYAAIKNQIRSIFLAIPGTTDDTLAYVKNKAKELISPESVIYTRFDQLYEATLNAQSLIVDSLPTYSAPRTAIHFETSGETDPLNGLSNIEIRAYDALVDMLVLLKIYNKASEWPMAEWDEYYEDGTPVTLNWELIINGLGKVYTAGLNLVSGPAMVGVDKMVPTFKKVLGE
jgi:hypothetical protein